MYRRASRVGGSAVLGQSCQQTPVLRPATLGRPRIAATLANLERQPRVELQLTSAPGAREPSEGAAIEVDVEPCRITVCISSATKAGVVERIEHVHPNL
jgi:hypothetical protein